MNHHFDVLIIGSGAAGLSAAIRLAEAGKQVGLICKGSLQESSTLYAQGGIAAVLDSEDTLAAHIQDTLISGAGLCDEKAVRFTVENGRGAVEWLIAHGVQFTQEQTESGEWRYHLNLEGGHSHRRIIHSDDETGRSVSTTLVEVARSLSNIHIFENQIAIDLIKQKGRVVGCYALDEGRHAVITFSAHAVILATGGASRVYLYSTNPRVSSGDGIAMGYRAGCRVKDLEFNQFHPTCLYHPLAHSFLLTEALRGEGATLLLPDGTRFMPKFHPLAELAPRDIVARAIDHEMKRLGIDCVYLDISHKDSDLIIQHFPNIYQKLLDYGLDLTRDRIPVVPAAHYTCGGLIVDIHARTDIPGLYAAGEVTCTGLHGGNRMASNSLLECLVYAKAAVQDILANFNPSFQPASISPWDDSFVHDSEEEVMVTQNWDELRRFMWNYVGIVRSDKRLARANDRVQLLKHEVQEYYAHFRVSRDVLELRNLIVVADLIVQAAMARKESIGLHFNLDYPTGAGT